MVNIGEELYIDTWIKDPALPTILFVHGGPGMNSALYSNYARSHFATLAVNWIFYDQRGCGKSKPTPTEKIGHDDNIEDLYKVLQHIDRSGSAASILLGHSYGAWLAYDCACKYDLKQDLVLVGADEIRTRPRIQSAILEIQALKQQNPSEYETLLPKLVEAGDEFWKISPSIRQHLKSLDFRWTFYWANLEQKKKIDDLKKHLNDDSNHQIFTTVRESIYQEGGQYLTPLDTEKTRGRIIRILGFHDFLMSGHIDPTLTATVKFYGSAHYPMYEEPNKFIQTLKGFL